MLIYINVGDCLAEIAIYKMQVERGRERDRASEREREIFFTTIYRVNYDLFKYMYFLICFDVNFINALSIHL